MTTEPTWDVDAVALLLRPFGFSFSRVLAMTADEACKYIVLAELSKE